MGKKNFVISCEWWESIVFFGRLINLINSLEYSSSSAAPKAQVGGFLKQIMPLSVVIVVKNFYFHFLQNHNKIMNMGLSSFFLMNGNAPVL